jgi:hypothetical protein
MTHWNLGSISSNNGIRFPLFNIFSVILLFLVLQFSFLSYVFPISEIFSLRPLSTIDNAFHLYQIDLAVDFWNQGKLGGYDPRFSAGYLGGLAFNASAKLPALASALLQSVLEPVQVYKFYVFLLALLGPLCVPVATSFLGLGRRVALYSGTLGLMLWWISGFHWYHTAGMVAYVFGCYATLPFCALLYKIVTGQGSYFLTLWISVLGAFLFFLHPLFPLPVIFFVLVALAYYRSIAFTAPLFMRLSIIAVLSLIPNLIWLGPLLFSSGLVSDAASHFQVRINPMVIPLEMIGLFRDPAMGSKVYPLLFALSILGVWWSDQRALARIFLAVWAMLVIFAAVGAALPGAGAVQPNRFSVMAYLFLTIPAGIGLSTLIYMVLPNGKKRLLKYAMLGIIGLFNLVLLWELGREVSYADIGRYGVEPPPEVRGLGAINTDLLAWLKQNTTKDARVLFETSFARVHDGSHSAGLLAMESDREFVGGPYVYLFFAGFWDGHVFGKRIEEIKPEQFVDYLSLYNVGWIAVHTDRSKNYLEKFSKIIPGPKFGPVQTYQVEGSKSFFASGSGEIIQSNTNHLVVKSWQKIGSELTLKYHYINGMKAKDGSLLSPVYFMDDPDPFIRVTPKDSFVEIEM